MPKPAVNPKPMFWNEGQAWDFPTIWDAIQRNNKSKVPNALIAVIFFEETSFVNRQQGGKSGPAVGFGQIEVGNRDKVRFYSWLKDPDLQVSDGLVAELVNEQLSPAALREKLSLQEKVKTKMLGSKEYSVQITCKYFQYLSEVAGKDQSGVVSAQIGSHLEYRKRFQMGYDALVGAMGKAGVDRKQLRTEYINALNTAKRRQDGEAATTKDNPIPEKNFTLFWDWVLPEEFLRKQASN